MIDDLDNVDFISSNVNSSRQEAWLYVFEDRSGDQDDLREEARQWDMFPELTELLLIGDLTESIWNPKSKSNMLTPKKQLADILANGSFSRDEWNHLLFVQH